MVTVVYLGGLLQLWRKREKPSRLPRLLLGCGVFFAATSSLMLRYYANGVTLLSVGIPVVMLLGVVYLLYPREFSVGLSALVFSLCSVILLNRGASTSNGIFRIRVLVTGAIVVIAILLAAVALLRRNGGALRRREGDVVLLPKSTNYLLLVAVLAFAMLAPAAALLISGAAYYAIWALAVVIFLLAVYYTVRIL